MAEEKTVLKFFTITQYQQEEEYLSSMHEQGWKLTKIIFPGLYHFQKCEPQKVVYRLDYNQEGIDHKAEYVQMFTDCGWNYLFDFMGYSYFCKQGNQMEDKEEIFCDDASRYEMMKRVFRGRIIPLIIVFMCIVIPQLVSNTLGYGDGGILQDVISVIFLILAVLYLAIFGVTAYWFYQYEKKLLPENSGIKYKYGGIAALLVLMMAMAAGFFCFFN